MMTADKAQHQLCFHPGVRRITCRTLALQELMLATDGEMLLGGTTWRIATKKLCPDVYSVWLEDTDALKNHTAGLSA